MPESHHNKTDDPLVNLGRVITQRRQALKLSQAQLAEMTGVHRTYLSDIERGQRNVTFLTLSKIASCLKTTTGKLVVAAEKLKAQPRPTSGRKTGGSIEAPTDGPMESPII